MMIRNLSISLIVFILLLLWLAACTTQPISTQTPTIIAAAASTAMRTLTPTVSPSPTITHTPTRTPTRTRTSHPTSTFDLSPAIPMQTIGKGLVSDIVRSEDGKLLAVLEDTWTENARLRWLDAASGKELGSARPGNVYGLIGFSSDHHWLLAYSTSGAHVINTDSGEVRSCCGGGNGSGFGFRFSADNHYLSYTGADRTSGGPYYFVDVFTLDPAYDFDIPTSTATFDFNTWNQKYPILNPDLYHTMSESAISPDSRWLAAGYHDSGNDLLYVWGLKTATVRYAIPHIAEINSVDFSPDGRFLASGGDDGVIRLFNVATGRLERVITGFTDSISRLRFSADSRQIIVSISKQPGQVFDLVQGSLQPRVTPTATPDPFLETMHRQGYADGSSVLFSPDGQTLAIGGESVQLWDVHTQEIKLSIEGINQGTALGWAFSADGKQLAQIYDAGDIVVWDTRTGDVLLNLTSKILEAGQVYYAAGGGIGVGIGSGVYTGQGIAFSPDSRQIAFGNGNGIEIWDIASASNVIRMAQPVVPAYATRVSFSADGKHLYAVINRNRDAQVWDTASGKLVKELDLPPVDPNAFSATALNGPLFARNNYNDSGYWVELWNLETGQMYKLPVLARETEPLRFSPDGSLLVALSKGHLYFWKTATGELLDWMKFDVSLPSLAISPDNTTLAIGDNGKAQLWDIAAIAAAAKQADYLPAVPPPTPTPWSYYATDTPEPTAPFVPPNLPTLPAGAIAPANAARITEIAHFGRGTMNDMIWASAPLTLLTIGPQGIYAFGGNPLAEAAYLPSAVWAESVVQLPNGDILAAGVISQSVQVWNLSTNDQLANLAGASPVRLHPTGKLLVYGDADGNLHTYDLAASQPIAILYSMYQSQLPVFSPDGSLVAAVNGYETRLGARHFVRIWDTYTGQIVNAVGGVDAAITDLSFSADGKFVAGAAGGSAWVWEINPEVSRPYKLDLYTSEHNYNLTLYHQRVTAAALSPDSRLLAVGDSERNIRLYEMASGKLIFRMTGHAASIYRLRFSPDGTRLLSADSDGQVILWNVSSGAMVASLDAHTGSIRGMILGLDGNLRAWANNTVWTLNPQDGALLHTTSVYSGTIFAVSPAGDWLAVSNRLRMSIWNADSGAFSQLLEGEAGDPFIEHMWEGIILRGYYRAFFDADGSQLTTKAPGEIWIYELDSHQQFQQVSYEIESTYQILDELDNPTAVSPKGLFSVQAVQRWQNYPDLVLYNQSGRKIESLPFPQGSRVTALAFSPDARLIAVGLADGSIALVDVVEWKLVVTFWAHPCPVTSLAFSADGLFLASGGCEGIVRFWGVPK